MKDFVREFSLCQGIWKLETSVQNTPSTKIGTSHQGLKNFGPEYPPWIGASLGGFVVDWCVETAVVSAGDTVYFYSYLTLADLGAQWTPSSPGLGLMFFIFNSFPEILPNNRLMLLGIGVPPSEKSWIRH